MRLILQHSAIKNEGKDETLFEKQCWQRKINISVVHNYDALFVGAIWKDVALNELETIW